MTHPTADIIPHFLKHIPQSNQSPMTIAQIIGDDVPDGVLMMLAGCVYILHLFGIVQIEEAPNPYAMRLQARSQTAKYALISLASYLESDIAIISDWETRGTAATSPQAVIETGAKFLQVLESRRVQLLAHAPASRHEKVAQVIISRRVRDGADTEILFQFDSIADRYQLIGGRWRHDDGEDMLQTAIREIREEIGDNLSYPQDYQLTPLIQDVSSAPTISPTFGALTQYRFWIYHIRELRRPITLQPIDRWISLSQIKQGFVLDVHNQRQKIGFTDLLPLFPQNLLENLADSFSSTL